MKHPALQALYAEWNRLRGDRAAPERSALSPAAMPNALADTFVLSYDPELGHPIRLAGSRICALFGTELRGMCLLDIIAPECHADLATLVVGVADSQTPVICGLIAMSREHGALELEMLLLPMRDEGATHSRMLGGLAAARLPWWLANDPLSELHLVSARHLDGRRSSTPPRLRVVAGAAV